MPRNLIVIVVAVIALGAATYYFLGQGRMAQEPQASAPAGPTPIPTAPMPGQAMPVAPSPPAQPLLPSFEPPGPGK